MSDAERVIPRRSSTSQGVKFMLQRIESEDEMFDIMLDDYKMIIDEKVFPLYTRVCTDKNDSTRVGATIELAEYLQEAWSE
ncbi:unnamed protein product, partial [Amoebophrya sp. A25]|eukprot:GSA25T00002347001.1